MFSLIATTLLILQLFSPNLGLMAESQGENEVGDETVAHATALETEKVEEIIEIEEPKKVKPVETEEPKEQTNSSESNKDDKKDDDPKQTEEENKVDKRQKVKVESKKEIENLVNEDDKDTNQEETTEISPMAIGTPGHYTIDPNSIVVPAKIEGVSTNAHTLTEMLWANGDTVYFAVKATHNIQYMELNGVRSTVFDVYNPWISIFVDGTEYEPQGLSGNTKDAHWTVFKFNLADLNLDESGRYTFFIKGIGGGHDVGGHILIELPKTDVEGKKVWIGGTVRPAITLQLMGQVSGEEKHVLATGVVDGKETPAWTYNWTKIPTHDPYGRQYTFTVDEETVPVNYEKSIDGLTVTNTYNPKQINIDVNKKWIGPATESVTIKLLANEVESDKTLVLNEANKWSGSFTELNKYDDTTGDLIVYTVEELDIPGYTSKLSGSVEGGFTFTNINDEKTSVHVQKVWEGPEKGPITIKLLANGEETDKEIELKAPNWSGDFVDLRKYDSVTGELIKYTVEEVDIPYGYEVKYSIGPDGIIIVTNNALKGAKVTATYVDEDGNEIADPIILEGYIGETYTTEQKEITGYEFKEVHQDSDPVSGEFTEEEQTVIYVYTKSLGSLTVEKVDEKGKTLAGATFKLYDSKNIEVGTFTTNQDGIIKFENLEWGTYTLVETKAPEGYRLLTNKITVEITKENLHVEKTVENSLQDWSIPKTGGIGTLGFYGVGLLFMVAGVWTVLRRRYV